MYKNLLYLKNYDGNVEDLGLDFTIVNSEIGQTEVNESIVLLKYIFRRFLIGDGTETQWKKYCGDQRKSY